jgi:hypothetical protein
MQNYKIAPICIIPNKKSSLLSEIFIAQVDLEKENLAGKLFILIEMRDENSHSVKIVNFLIDNISRNYYQSDKLILREKIYSLKPEHIFEAALAKANKQFHEFLEEEKIKFSFKGLNITAGLLYDNEIFFSNTGKNNVLLIHKVKNESGEPDKDFKIVNVTKQTKDEEKSQKQEIFSNIINGKIPPQGHFLITNEALLEYLSSKQIIGTITTLPPCSAAEQIKNILSRINYFITFSGIIIKNSQSLPDVPRLASKITSSESFLDLSRTEDATEKILSPTGMFKIKNWLLAPLALLLGSTKAKKNQTIILKDKIYSKRQGNLFNQVKITNFLKNSLSGVLNIIFCLIKSVSDKSKILSYIKQATDFIKGIIIRTKILNFKKKILLAIAMLSLIAILINIQISSHTKKIEETNAIYQQLVADIEKKENQIEANLLYSNDKGAQNLFSELSALLENFPKDTEAQKQQYEDFQAKLKDQLNKVRKAEVTDSPEMIVDLRNINPDAAPDNLNFVAESGNLYSADTKQKSVYIIGIKDKTVTTVADLNAETASLSISAATSENTISYFNGTSIIELDAAANQLKNLAITTTAVLNDFTAADSYGGRFYIMNKTKNQIYRFAKSGNAYGSPVVWNNESLDLSQASDIAIDGYVYIINNDGSIMRLLRGNKTEFSLEQIDPVLQAPALIKTNESSNFIYVGEPKEKRVVVYDKKGQFIIQYTSAAFDNLKDFSVDEKNKSIYVLSGDKIYAIKLTHIQ